MTDRGLDLVRVLQFGDSMLPVGAFSFSNGLEAAIQQRLVHDVTTLRGFVRTALQQATTGDGIALLAAHRACSEGREDELPSIDHAVLHRKLNDEMRTMTVRMGQKLVELGARVVGHPAVAKYLSRIKSGEACGTYPVAFAMLFAVQGLAASDAFAAHQYGVATMMIGAALRLMKLSYLDGQALLYELNGEVGRDYASIESATLDEMATFAPVADILAACHLKSEVRLFMS